ncbi:MAG: polyphosphate:AMP phosphotransferase [Clostridiales bacterium]|jgi:polyphosphate:AMP phosphotransferase|nr:polyphosphate:AMP phosphotransferase [Clostridiales bacterium]
MLSKVDLTCGPDKKGSKEELDAMEKKLTALQLAVRDSGIPVIIVFEGWGASGKGTHIAKIVNPLDPRYFNVYTMGKVNEDMVMRPFLWPYWVRTPAKGRLTIFDKSWHRIGMPDGVQRWRLNPSEIVGFYQDVNAFEKQLTDDGTLILKFFLHISQDEQKKRFKDLERSADTAWRVDTADWAQNKEYDRYAVQFNQMLELTHTEENPWHIIESEDKKYAINKIYKIIIARLEARIQALEGPAPKSGDRPAPVKEARECAAKLDGVALNKTVDDDEYRKDLSQYQKRLSALGSRLYLKRRPVLIAFEGWDAAGKGGNIKRLTEELDPRCYEVIPIGTPTASELSHHYLWRFFNKIPKDGHFAIFDRSWYGRVLVERVEKLTPEPVWRRAYGEINEMEAHFAHHGAIIIKFWLHIDQDEQLERFNARQNDPLKQYKITDEDWRNRAKWQDYTEAVEEMLSMTDTRNAPWCVVEANNKKFARLKVIKTVVETLENALR